MRGATIKRPQKSLKEVISIHAPHAGSDYQEYLAVAPVMISIHAPHAGSDSADPKDFCLTKFQSTLPMRGATQGTIDVIDPGDFNPRSPCGERQEGQMNETDLMHISIHAPHAGSDRS